jgi:hypothetical protein
MSFQVHDKIMKKIVFGLLFLIILLFSNAVAQDEVTNSAWPNQYYAPYVYASGYPISAIAKIADIHYLTLAFVLSSPQGCQAAWGGAIPFDQQKILPTELETLRERGGDVIVAFGGAGGTELAQACTDVESLTAQYQSVIDTYNVSRLDFDIEGDEIHEGESVLRRSQAIAALQKQAADAGKQIQIAFTLPVLPTGLTDDGLAVLQSAIDNGVEIGLVNIMTMNFGKDYPPDEMGKLTIQAADGLYAQLATLYPDKPEADVWSMIGLIPMIGLNDSAPEVFTLDDANMVVSYAQKKGIHQISMWALSRDKACSGDAKMISEICSGVSQDPYAYSAVFNTFTSYTP